MRRDGGCRFAFSFFSLLSSPLSVLFGRVTPRCPCVRFRPTHIYTHTPSCAGTRAPDPVTRIFARGGCHLRSSFVPRSQWVRAFTLRNTRGSDHREISRYIYPPSPEDASCTAAGRNIERHSGRRGFCETRKGCRPVRGQTRFQSLYMFIFIQRLNTNEFFSTK